MDELKTSKLGIVIPTFNRALLLENLLKQIFQYKKEWFEYSIIIINDGSTDNTQHLIDKYTLIDKDFHCLNGDGSWWWAKSFNVGMVECFDKYFCDFVLSLNDDVEIDLNFFEELKSTLKKLHSLHSGLYMLNCAAFNIKNGEFSDLGIIKKGYSVNSIYRNQLNDFSKFGLAEVNHNHGRGMIVTKQIYNLIGTLDYINFPQYLGDSDYALRAQKAGAKQYYTIKPSLKSFVELTSKTKYEIKYSFNNLYKKLTDKYSDSSIKILYIFNKRHYKGFQFYYITFIETLKIVGGYFKRWLKN